MRSKSCLALVVTVLLSTVFSSAPVMSWTWTAADPLLFQFADNDNSVFTNPNAVDVYKTYAEAPYATIDMNGPRSPSGGVWQHAFSSAGTGSLTIQAVNSATGRSWIKGGSHASTAWTGIVSTLDWGNGFVAEIKSKCVGDADLTTWPEGYNWSGNYGVGGFEYNWYNLPGNPAEAPTGSADSGLAFVWNTYDPTTTEDDVISLQNYVGGVYASANYSLGGSPTSAPEHIYKLYVRRSPLAPQQRNDLILATVYVDGAVVPELKNRTILTAGDSWGDGIQIGNRGYGPGGNNRRGDEYDYVKLWEADAIVDTDNPSAPVASASAVSSSSIRLTWNASTDATTSVIGYWIERNGEYIGYVEWLAEEYIDSGLAEETVYSYSVAAVDEVGNLSEWSNVAVAATPPAPSITELTYNFNDIPGTTIVTYSSSPNYFHTSATEDSNFYLGRKYDGTGADGSFYYDGSPRYLYTLTDADNGSLTIQSATPANETGSQNGRTSIMSSDFGNWFKWIRRPDYPEPGKTYVRGISMETEMDIVGDLHGWCAEWDTFPAVGECEWTNHYGHFGSDWGSQSGNRAGVRIEIDDLVDLATPTHAGFGNTGNGVQMWVAICPADLTTAADDEVRVYNGSGSGYARFKFRDGLGLGLTPEDGRDPAHPRDGIITGSGNKIMLKVALCKAPVMPGYTSLDNWEYWDVWVKRPIDADYIHINPLTCDNLITRVDSQFGGGGHSLWTTYYASRSRLTLGNQDSGNIWGTKFNWIKMRNDWNGEIIIHVDSLAEVRQLGAGSQVSFDATGGEKIVTMDPTSADFQTYFFYIEQEDRSMGIKVVDQYMVPMVSKGQQITSLSGVLLRDLDGNLYIDVTDKSVTADTTTKTIEPLGMNNQTVSGSAATGGTGLANTGLLATVWGKVSDVGSDALGNVCFELDDGSGVKVKVWDFLLDGVIVSPQNGEYWTATGVIALESDGAGGFRRVLHSDSARKVN